MRSVALAPCRSCRFGSRRFCRLRRACYARRPRCLAALAALSAYAVHAVRLTCRARCVLAVLVVASSRHLICNLRRTWFAAPAISMSAALPVFTSSCLPVFLSCCPPFPPTSSLRCPLRSFSASAPSDCLSTSPCNQAFGVGCQLFRRMRHSLSERGCLLAQKGLRFRFEGRMRPFWLPDCPCPSHSSR